jgi:hypothetical protein
MSLIQPVNDHSVEDVFAVNVSGAGGCGNGFDSSSIVRPRTRLGCVRFVPADGCFRFAQVEGN